MSVDLEITVSSAAALSKVLFSMTFHRLNPQQRKQIIQEVVGDSVELTLARRKKRAARSKLHLAPGRGLSALAAFVFSRGTFKEYFQPYFLDLQADWTEAHERGDLRKAAWLRYRAAIWFVVTIISFAGSEILKRLFALVGPAKK